MNSDLIEFITVLVWVLSALLGLMLGVWKNRKILGLVLGIFLGLVGCVIMVFVSEREGEPEGCGSLAAFGLVVAAAVGAAFLYGHLKLKEQEAAEQSRRLEAMQREQAAGQRYVPRTTPDGIIEGSGPPIPAPYIDPNATAASRARAASPRPMFTPRPTPSPQAVNAEIERKYGIKK